MRCALACFSQQRSAPLDADPDADEEGEEEVADASDAEAEAEPDAAGAEVVEVVVARRWRPADAPVAGGKPRRAVVQYLVKWRGRSYLHVEWRTEGALLRANPKVGPKLKAFAREAPPLGPPPSPPPPPPPPFL